MKQMPSEPSTARISAALNGLREVLEREKDSGDGITVSAESVSRLRELPAKLQSRPAVPVVAPPSVAAAPSPRIREEPADTSALPTAIPEIDSRGIEVIVPQGSTKAEKLEFLKNLAENCEACRGLGSLRDDMVFSVGNPDAELMFVGEAPGFEEERQREPFVGPAGQKLTQIIGVMGLKRPDDVYISNIVKFRPKIGDGRFQGQKNRKPTPDEMGAAVKYVMAEIDVVRPRAIVAVGGTAAEGLLDLSGSVSRMRNQFYDLKGIPVMVTYHPSYLLRAESNSADKGKSEKRKVWEDLLLVMGKMGLPISEKQRAFFS
jgi:uracil-DNA glycosylase family 4